MKTNRILFAITLISSPLLLNAYHEGLGAMSGNTLANSQNTLRATGGSALVDTRNQRIITSGQRNPVTHTSGEIVAPVSGRGPVLGQERRDDNRRYFGTQPEIRDSGMVTPLRK